MTDDNEMGFPEEVRPMKYKRWNQIEALLWLYQSRGRKLSELVGPKHFGVSLRTLKDYCRRFDVAFDDYTPRQRKVKLKPETGAENE